MAKPKSTNYEDLQKLEYDKKIQEYRKLAKRANVRLKAQEDKGLEGYIYGQASFYNKDQQGRDKNRFYEGKNFKDETELNNALQQVSYFNNAKTSTISGIKKYNKNVKVKFEERFKNENIEIKDIKSFTQFLYSEQFKDLKKYVASDQLLTDFSKAMDDGATPQQIMADYEDFMNSDITFEQIAEQRALWKDLLQ